MRNSGASLLGPLPIRLIVGLAFTVHGYPKIVNIARTEGFLAQIGLPTALAGPIALLEFVGGIALILGTLTRIASALFVAEMTGTTMAVKLQHGFVGGYELDLLLLAAAASLLLTGPGRISIEWDVLKREIFPSGKNLVPR